MRAGTDLNYNSAAHKDAVTHIGATQKYWYDANGSQTKRIVNGQTINLTYDAENRLSQVKKNNTVIATFTYDGDGRRVKSVMGSETTVFIGGHYEITGSTITKYYFAGAQRVAMRSGSSLYYLLGDHASTQLSTSLGSTSHRCVWARNTRCRIIAMTRTPHRAGSRHIWRIIVFGPAPILNFTNF